MENNIKTKRTKAEIMEVLVVILLGLVTVLTAWATWIGSLHGGNQATNYTESNNKISEGNSMWNEAAQNLSEDMQIWDEISALKIEYTFAEQKGNQEKMEECDWKIDQIMADRVTEDLGKAIEWAESQEEYASPFDMPGFIDGYYADAEAKIAEAKAMLEQGKKDNNSEDSYGLVSVIYSIVLFLLGISSSFKSDKNKMALIIIGIVGTVLATIYMCTLPMPTGFTFASYFSGN